MCIILLCYTFIHAYVCSILIPALKSLKILTQLVITHKAIQIQFTDILSTECINNIWLNRLNFEFQKVSNFFHSQFQLMKLKNSHCTNKNKVFRVFYRLYFPLGLWIYSINDDEEVLGKVFLGFQGRKCLAFLSLYYFHNLPMAGCFETENAYKSYKVWIRKIIERVN